jgi:hypothetical protein
MLKRDAKKGLTTLCKPACSAKQSSGGGRRKDPGRAWSVGSQSGECDRTPRSKTPEGDRHDDSPCLPELCCLVLFEDGFTAATKRLLRHAGYGLSEIVLLARLPGAYPASLPAGRSGSKQERPGPSLPPGRKTQCSTRRFRRASSTWTSMTSSERKRSSPISRELWLKETARW